MKKNFLGVLVISICIVYFSILASLIIHFIQPHIDIETIKTIFTVPVENFRPEPQERTLFLIASLSIPFICAGAYILLSNIISKGQQPIIREAYRSFSFWSVVAVFLLALSGIRNAEFSYLGASSLVQAPMLTLVFNSIIFVLVVLIKSWVASSSFFRKNIPGLIYFSIGLTLIGLLGWETIFNEYEPYVSGISFTSYFDSIVQVYLGKTLLVDFSPQYGVYALLLIPIFKIIGLSVFKFTAIMEIIKTIAYLSMLLVIWQVTKNKLIGLMGFATIVFYTRMRVPLDVTKDPYFQYYPHRMIFPALFILFLWLYITNKHSAWKKSIYYGLITLLCPISILWNPDTGLVVMATWLIYLVYQELLLLNQVKLKLIISNCVKHFTFNLGGAICILSAFYFYTYLSSGMWPDIASSADYIKLFNFYGFYMLPMPAIHPWNMVILFYCIGLFISISYLIDVSGSMGFAQQSGQDQFIPQLIFALSILGVGLFYYYVGRSHDWNLIGPSWPMFILATIFTDYLFTQLSPLIYSSTYGFKTKLFVVFRKDFKALAFVGLFYFMSASFLSIFLAMPVYLGVISKRWAGVEKHGLPLILNNEADFIHLTSSATDNVFILSDFAPELYLYTHHARPVNVPGFGELGLRKDMDKIIAFLSHPPKDAKIYWDPDFRTISPADFINLHSVASIGKHMILFEDYNP